MEKENGRREDEHLLQKHKLLFEEWEKIQSNIRTLCQDLRDGAMDEATRAEIEEDISGLVQ